MEYKPIYDTLFNILITNLYTISKGTQKVIIKNFNPKDKKHLVIINGFEILHIFNTFKNCECYIDCNIIDFIYFKIKYRKIKLVKKARKSQLTSALGANEILQHISNGNNQPMEIWNEIYDCFYQEGK